MSISFHLCPCFFPEGGQIIHFFLHLLCVRGMPECISGILPCCRLFCTLEPKQVNSVF